MLNTLAQYFPLVLAAVIVVYAVYRDRQLKAKTEEQKETKEKEEKKEHEAEKERDVEKAKVALDTAGVKGKERLDTIASVRHGDLTGDDVVEAHKK